MKQRIRLTESDLRSIIRKCVSNLCNEVYDGRDVANNTLSGQNDFTMDYTTNAHKFTHDGADAYWARKDQDKMHKNEKRRKSYDTKRINQIADKDLGLNKDLRGWVKKDIDETISRVIREYIR